jgi:hypothetical protein
MNTDHGRVRSREEWNWIDRSDTAERHRRDRFAFGESNILGNANNSADTTTDGPGGDPSG